MAAFVRLCGGAGWSRRLADLAGRTDLIAGFLEAQSSPAKVRSQLLATQAEASPEIVSRTDPQSAMSASSTGHPASPHNPLIQAVKSRLGTK